MTNENDKKEHTRTLTQNKALHQYFALIANELINQGQTMQDVVEKINMTEIYPSMKTVKELIWRPIMEAQIGKVSSRELTTAEINQVYEPMAQFLSTNFEISIPFPSQENTDNYLQSYENN